MPWFYFTIVIYGKYKQFHMCVYHFLFMEGVNESSLNHHAE